MKTTDFATHLNRYFTVFLPSDQGCSPQTIDTYRYAFILYLTFMEEEKNIRPEKLTIGNFDRNSIINFLDWLETKRNNSVSSRNNRLAALKAFVNYLKYEFPEYLEEYQKILAIPIKKGIQPDISYMKAEGVELLVKQIDINETNGLRDFIILLLLYSTGIRVSELIGIRVKDLSMTEPFTLKVHGKGNKTRHVPLLKTTVQHLRKYLEYMHYDNESRFDEILFKNHMGEPFTRQGINYLLKKYGDKASKVDCSLVPTDLSPHKIRHSTAMELLSQGVDLIYIRDLLGHVSITTTEIYARTDAQAKRKAIEAASKELVPHEEAKWDMNMDLKSWLKSFNRSKR